MTKAKTDRTFSPEAAFGSSAWVAHRLGIARDTFLSKRVKLEGDGFPSKDTLLGGWLKADVIAWIEKRRKVSDPDPKRIKETGEGINLDAI